MTLNNIRLKRDYADVQEQPDRLAISRAETGTVPGTVEKCLEPQAVDVGKTLGKSMVGATGFEKLIKTDSYDFYSVVSVREEECFIKVINII